jgi:hypothetical protein
VIGPVNFETSTEPGSGRSDVGLGDVVGVSDGRLVVACVTGSVIAVIGSVAFAADAGIAQNVAMLSAPAATRTARISRDDVFTFCGSTVLEGRCIGNSGHRL